MTDSKGVVGLVLAAGASTRLGQPKQLVEYQGQTLVANVANQLLLAGCSAVITVLGSNANQILPAVENLPTTVVINKNWPSGIGNSISFAMEHIGDSTAALLISLCDQPLIETKHYHNLIQNVLSGEHSIAATEYSPHGSGVPAAFTKRHFEELRCLDGDVGARQIIQANDHATLKVLGQILDIDTQQDLEALSPHSGN